MGSNYQILLEEVRQTFASVVWTHKIQEKQADIYESKYKKLEIANIIFAACTSTGIFATIILDVLVAKIITTILSFITLALTLYFKSFDVKDMEKQHRNAAVKFVIVRNRLLHLISEIHLKEDWDKLKNDYEEIIKDLECLYMDAPSTTKKAVDLAGKSLTEGEYTFDDVEIDRFLPQRLWGGIE